MNKLKSKVFWTLFTIFTTFLITIILIFNYQGYQREKMNIEQNLFRMSSVPEEKEKKEDFPRPNDDKEPFKEEKQRRFMDVTIYTIILNEENNISEIISHREDGIVNEEVEKIASKIIEQGKEKTTIKNLYFSNYSYKYEKGKAIILIDHHDARKRLISSLKIALLLFIVIELIIIIISKKLSEWLIKPVEVSFNKQKQFIADASHELKTPISIIMASAETLENNPKELKWIENIKSESERMSKLITSLLDLAKVENENNKELYDKINLSKLVEKESLIFESLAFEKNVKLYYEIKENIYFNCNSEEIKNLLSILLDNAIKHSPQKGKINISLNEDKSILTLNVTNKGEPIPKGEEEKIFERFYRVDKSRNRDDNRYGLGLSIAKSIVLKHNGKITATSKDGYTTFKIILKK